MAWLPRDYTPTYIRPDALPPDWLPESLQQAWLTMNDIDVIGLGRETVRDGGATEAEALEVEAARLNPQQRALFLRLAPVARQLGEFTVARLAEAAGVSADSARRFARRFAVQVRREQVTTQNNRCWTIVYAMPPAGHGRRPTGGKDGHG